MEVKERAAADARCGCQRAQAKVTDEDLADYLIENDPEFRSKIEESYAEYLSLGGIEAGGLVKKLEKRHGRKAA